jgi:hypothetical protein
MGILVLAFGLFAIGLAVAECPASAPMRQIGRVEEGRISGSS